MFSSSKESHENHYQQGLDILLDLHVPVVTKANKSHIHTQVDKRFQNLIRYGSGPIPRFYPGFMLAQLPKFIDNEKKKSKILNNHVDLVYWTCQRFSSDIFIRALTHWTPSKRNVGKIRWENNVWTSFRWSTDGSGIKPLPSTIRLAEYLIEVKLLTSA